MPSRPRPFPTVRSLLLSFVLAWLIGLCGAAVALDSRYLDADGDLVADPPEDPARWIDPSTLVFTYTPAEDPSLYARIFAELVDHLARRTGRKVQFLQVHSNAAMVEAMRAGAFTYLNKPFEPDEMLMNVRMALETTRLKRELRAPYWQGHKRSVAGS